MQYACTVQRTSVILPDDLAARLRYASKQRGVSVAEVVREAVERHLGDGQPAPPQRLSFFALGEGPVDGSERVDDYVRDSIVRRLASG